MDKFIEDQEIISFSSLFNIFWRWKWLIIIVTFICASLSVWYAVKQSDVYRAEIMAVIPSNQNTGLSSMMGGLDSLAGLAGVSLGGASDKSLEQMKDLIRSRSFLQQFIERHDLIVDVIAAVDWDKTNNVVIYNPELYDETSQTWVRTPPPGKKVIPTSWEAYPMLLSKIQLEALTKKNMFKISVDHFSPHLAKKWAELLLSDLNTLYRERTKKEAKDAIDYLKGVVEITSLNEVHSTVYSLLEEQIKKSMLTEVKNEFALETLSGAILPEDKDYPKRGLICIIGTILGGVLSLILALMMNAIFPNKTVSV